MGKSVFFFFLRSRSAEQRKRKIQKDGSERRRPLRVCWIEKKKKSNRDEKPSLSLSLTGAELAAQSSRAQASSTAEAAARERAIGVARRGEFEGRGENETAFLAFEKRESGGARLFSRPPPFFFFFLQLFFFFFSFFRDVLFDSSGLHCFTFHSFGV